MRRGRDAGFAEHLIARLLLIVVGSMPIANEQQSARQPFLAGVEKLVDQVVLDSA